MIASMSIAPRPALCGRLPHFLAVAGLSSASCVKLIGRPQAGYGSGKVFTGSFKSIVQSYFLASTASRICEQARHCLGVEISSQGKEVYAFGFSEQELLCPERAWVSCWM